MIRGWPAALIGAFWMLWAVSVRALPEASPATRVADFPA